jgi:tRNA G18 (ribose-2'-O)-methylase SpoU
MPRAPRPSRHEFLTLPRRPIRVVLDGVTYLPNIGTMFRLCDAFRIERLYICGLELQPHKRSLVTAAAGTIGWVPWESRSEALGLVREIKTEGYSVIAIEQSDRSVAPHELTARAPLCLVVGGENHGVSSDVLDLADQCVEIPTDGIGGSINLTTAAAIVLYEASRRFPLATSSR